MADTTTLDIVFTAPHPDDLEIGCGGTIAALVKQGYKVGMVHMTNGEPTPLGDPETRMKEMRAAADVLGVQVCEMLGLTNRVLMDGPEPRFALASVLRRYRAPVLVGIAGRTVAASPDHYQAQLITEATRFYSQLTKWDDRFGGTTPHAVDHLIYRPISRAAEYQKFPAEFVVDITDTMDAKIAAIACYKSQFPDERMARVEHYVRSLAGYEGGACGYSYGELYAVPRPIGVRDALGLFGRWPVPSIIDRPRF
ncbi:MAG TPA: PIG-L family deacetylase [Phycisphaerae bacterium]|nr:PIG-L family deacetylase [Phycisphaerae bacterium]HRW53178.1 PIG-L family deacetylase [Phycisphaerae bacterium]